MVAHACPAGAQIALTTWMFFQRLQWRHPDLPLVRTDFGVTWYELVVHYTLYAGRCLPIWIRHDNQSFAWPYAFDSLEVAIQKPEVKSLWHQAHNFRAVVQYLESTMKCHLYPPYKKTKASTVVRMGFHRSLTGGIASRPNLFQKDIALHLLRDYSAQAGQPYPLNVRIPFVPVLTHAR